MIQKQKGVFTMKKWDDLLEYLQDKNVLNGELLSKYCAKNDIEEENKKKCNTLLWVLAIIGAIAAVAAIAYAVYRYMTPDYLDDFDDEFDDDFVDDDFFDDEEDEAESENDEKEESDNESENDYTTVK